MVAFFLFTMCYGDMIKGAEEPWNQRQKKKKDKCNEFCVSVWGLGRLNEFGRYSFLVCTFQYFKSTTKYVICLLIVRCSFHSKVIELLSIEGTSTKSVLHFLII